jgi:parallel beta-helix repeat protein
MKSGKVTGGDRIFLLDGYHGQLLVRDKKFASKVTIAPVAGAVAHADSILVMNSSNVQFTGIKVWPRSSNATNQALVRSYSTSSNIAFTDLDVRGTATAGNYSGWTAKDWNTNQRTGFQVDGPNVIVARNRVTGIFNGIIMLGQNALMEKNIVDGFSGDGMRALGDNSIVRGNKVQNCHQVNASHTDAFQAWTNGPTGKVGTGTLRNLTIEDNKIFEFVGTRSPLACKLQGISLFAGVYDNFLIRNNIVSTTAYHGITIAGGQNSQIVNNTVIHALGKAGVFPWIRVSANRDGRQSLNMTVANNMTTSLKVKSDPATKIVETSNVVVANASNEFTGLTKQDFTLRSGSKAVDAGAPALAPKDDIAGTARPKGKAPDAGAYENF